MKNKGICIITEEKIPPVQRFSLSLKLAENLAPDLDVHLISLSDNPEVSIMGVNFYGVKVKNWDLFSLKKRIIANLKLTHKVCQVCAKNKIDLIYGWWPVAFISALICRKKYCVDMPEFLEEMYRSFKQPFTGTMNRILKFVQIQAAKKSEFVIVESEIAQNEWIKRGVVKNKINYAPYGVETELFEINHHDGIRERYKIPDDSMLLMYHGDIGFDDGVDLLVQATNSLDVYFLCIGDGPVHYMNKIKKIAGAKTFFTGWIPYSKIPQFLSDADIYIAPFRNTNYTNSTIPLKQMEAMAAGRPTICSRLITFSKYVEDKYDIRLFDPGNIEQLKQIISELADNKEMRLLLGRNARLTAKAKFNWQNRIQFESKILKDIINKVD